MIFRFDKTTDTLLAFDGDEDMAQHCAEIYFEVSIYFFAELKPID